MAKPETSSNVADNPEKPGTPKTSVLKWALVLLPLGFLWFRLINNLWLEWDTNPQYSYGLVVPILVVGLLMRRWFGSADRQCSPSLENPWLLVLAGALLAFLYLPTRLVEAATPEWRPLQWLLGIEVVGLTLYAVYLAGGKNWLRLAAFPVAFFLVSIPWPSLIETPLIQGLSRMNASMVVEVLGIVGVPSLQHGNVIEVSTGMVGINDACSGIRSFQSSLMIALFLGEFYLFRWPRRLWLVPIGFLLAMVLNLCRASLLTWIAATKGVAAIAQYHDEAGLTILLVCTALLWGIAWLMNWRKPAAVMPEPAKAADSRSLLGGKDRWRLSNRLAVMLIVWLVLVESGVALWYHVREANIKPGPDWTVVMPADDARFKELPLTPEEHELLRFDEGKKAQWEDPVGTMWQGFYFNWRPGRVAGYLAKRHTPDICLTATGLKMTQEPKLEIITVHGVELPMRHYVFESPEGKLQVFQCHWEAGLGKDTFTAEESSRFNLIRGVWAGRGNQGQKVLEMVLIGNDNPELAKKALILQLEKIIRVANPAIEFASPQP